MLIGFTNHKLPCSRIVFVDVAKGIGILLVIIGHVVPYGDNYLSRFIFGFHMPLFFILSGFTFDFKKYAEEPLKFKKKVIKFLRVYFLCILIGMTLTFSIKYFRNRVTLASWLNLLYYGWPADFLMGPLWYIVALLFAEGGGVFLYRHLCKRSSKWKLYSILICLCMLIIFNHIVNKIFPFIGIILFSRMPLRIDSATVGLMYIIVGSELKKGISNINNKTPIIYAVGIVSFLIDIVATYFNGSVSLNSFVFSNPILFVVTSCFGSLWVILLSVIIERKRCYKFLEYIGKNSIYYFCSHIAIIEILLMLIYNSSIIKESNLISVGWVISILLVCLSFVGSTVVCCVVKNIRL